MEIVPFSLIGGVILLTLIAVGAQVMAEKKRREELAAVAEAHDWRFEPRSDALAAVLGFLPLFQKGRRRKVRNLLAAVDARGDDTFRMFDYQYTIGGGKNSHTRRQTVVVLTLGVELPRFELRPEGFFDKIGSAFGFTDIDFDAYPDFSKRYLLRGESEVAVRALFGEALIATLSARHRLSVEADGRTLVIYRDLKREKTGDWLPTLEDANALGEAFTAAAESAPNRRMVRPPSATPADVRADQSSDAESRGSRRTRGVSYREVPRAKFD